MRGRDSVRRVPLNITQVANNRENSFRCGLSTLSRQALLPKVETPSIFQRDR